MQHKKRTYSIGRFKHYLHSIPTLFIMMKKNVKSNVLYSIPSVCVLALLLASCSNLLINRQSFAATGVTGNSNAEDYGTVTPVTTPTISPSASISLDHTELTSGAITPGVTATATTNVTVNVSDVETYNLILSVDSNTLQNGETVITAGNATTDNTWGYKWGLDSGDSYKAPSTAGSSLAVAPLSNGAANFTDTLTFGAKFSSGAAAGTYHGSGTLSLVATPKATTTITLAHLTQMQQITPDICEATPYLEGHNYSAEYTLTDVRDNGRYTVRKLGDDRCWMTNNLKLHDANFYDGDNSNVFYGARDLIPATSDVDAKYTMTVRNELDFNTDDTKQTSYYDRTLKTGYYTWCTATAGTCSSATSDGANAPSSICPKGWKLPTGGTGTGTDFHNLFKNMGLTISNSLSTSAGSSTSWGSGDLARVQGLPYSFTYTGRVYNGSLDSTDTDGYWWSSTAHSNTIAYLLYINSSVVSPGTNPFSRRFGFAVRCVAAEKTLKTIQTMQDMTSEVCAKSNVGDSNTLTDTRDNNSYSVRKMADGKCWMTQNLRLTKEGMTANGVSTITADNSNGTPANGWSMPASSVSGFSSDTASNAYLNGSTGYYTWCAATAGTCSGLSNSGDHAPSSICPKGWRLPGGYNDKTYGNEFYTLFNNMSLGITLNTSGSTSWSSAQLNIAQGSPYNFAYTGQVYGDTFHDPSSDLSGRWWSSTALDNTIAYYLIMFSSFVYPGTDNYYRHYGFAIRCIAE